MKKEYLAPCIEELGSLHELTLGQSQGMKLDSDFSAGTFVSDLTFS